MKQKITLALALVIISYCINAQTNKTCTITCNVTTAYVCPNSNTWKSNPNLYNDDGFMTEIGYTKDSKGCWKFGGTTINLKTTDKVKAESWWSKVKNYFSGAKKTGF